MHALGPHSIDCMVLCVRKLLNLRFSKNFRGKEMRFTMNARTTYENTLRLLHEHLKDDSVYIEMTTYEFNNVCQLI